MVGVLSEIFARLPLWGLFFANRSRGVAAGAVHDCIALWIQGHDRLRRRFGDYVMPPGLAC
jgi:hypothetical protein